MKKTAKKTKSRPPIVWMFQPHTFEVVTGKRLQEWEATIMQHVGLSGLIKADAVRPIEIGTGTCSYSHSGPKDSAPDDGDQD